MNLKLIASLLFLSTAFFNDCCAARVTNFFVNPSSLTGNITINGNNSVNLNHSGLTTVNYTVEITRSPGETGINLTFSLGTVLGSGGLFTFGGTYSVGDWPTVIGDVEQVQISNSQIDPSQPFNNKLVLLFSDHGGAYQLYGSNSYLTNYPITQLPFYRYYSSGLRKHLYTMDISEVGQNPGWSIETTPGLVYNQQASGDVALYRYFNPNNGDHYYTLTKGTYSGYVYERIAAFVYTTNVSTTVPLYQYFSSGGGHFYTTNYSELGGGSQGYTYGGIACYIYPTQ